MRNRKLIFFAIFFSLVYTLNYLGDDPKYHVQHIESEYEGAVIEIFFRKSKHIKVETDKGIIDLATMSPELARRVHVGDSIYKIKNSNKCVLVRKNLRENMPYIFIPNSARDDHRWPKRLSIIKATEQ